MKKNNEIKYHIEVDIALKKNPYEGLYIAFEGIDGSGKSTQSEKLEKYLREKGRPFIFTSEPRKEGSPVGILIHQILQAKVKIPMEAMQYLYTAERIANHSEVIEPALKKGETVISHRSLWSNLPYGMLDKGTPDYSSNDARFIDEVHGLMSLYHQFIVPDITFYLKVSVETAIKRLSAMDKVKEIYEKKEKLEKIIQGYEWEVSEYPDEFTVLNGEESEEKVFAQIKKIVDQNLK